MIKTCETCAAFNLTNGYGAGECRLMPPILQIRRLDQEDGDFYPQTCFDFPEVHEELWCLQWRKKEDDDNE